MSFDVKPLAGGFGREICGLDMAHGIDPATAAALKATWLEHGVLLFRGIGTSPEVQLELSRCFGELEPHPIEKFRLAGYPELILLSNEDGPTGPVYDFDGVEITQRIPWHTDLAFTTTPNAGALMAEPAGQGPGCPHPRCNIPCPLGRQLRPRVWLSWSCPCHFCRSDL